eukprot:CAMPEP_0176224180 /NCGR_PEP_ID=MMETSP0121_2-20121125/21121_1 /TAXON_ID=160619 /ORGANISM="Kryptoperidinium foliaceum, Strain CCMP 1326" /LENGTH=66 /DNA_ID=CAMNT_0017563425 /DNA_START=111 /DNA_END=308 /DNA_ORIENTATION=+
MVVATASTFGWTLGQNFSVANVFDLGLSDADLKGFNAGFQDGTFGYVVPNNNGKVARFSLQDFSSV